MSEPCGSHATIRIWKKITLENIDKKIRTNHQADSWAISQTFFPELVQGLLEAELLFSKESAGMTSVYTTKLGKEIIRCPEDIWPIYRERFEKNFRAFQVIALRTRRDNK